MRFDELNVAVREFCESRDWGQYHTPKDLAVGLVTATDAMEAVVWELEDPLDESTTDAMA